MEEQKKYKSIKDLSILEIELSDYMIEMDLLHPLKEKEQEKEETAEK